MTAKAITRLIQFVIFSLTSLYLAGCATPAETLGIPQAQWDQYSPEKQEQLRTAYQQTQAQKKKIVAKAGKGVLMVSIEGGQALLPPYTALAAYQPISFSLRQGDCNKQITVAQADNPGQKGKLTVCYKDDTLYMDPSAYDSALSLGAMQFPYMPAWKRGFTYPGVTSTGLLKLTDVDVTLKQVVSGNGDE